MASKTKNTNTDSSLRWIVIAGLIVVAFFGAYKFASANSGAGRTQVPATAATPAASQPAAQQTAASSQGGSASSQCGSGGCDCCDGGSSQPTANGVTGPAVEGTAQLAGGVQAIAVNVTTVYSPNVIHLKAGVPAEITFGSAQGCTGQVQSQQLGFAEDLTSGPKVVKIANPQAGTYDFACGMNMVHGKIVVE